MLPDRQHLIELNRVSWEYTNQRFNQRKGDYVQAIQGGQSIPNSFLNMFDPRPTDTILQLLCNDGREAAVIAYQTGAQVHGVDFSINAINFAKNLNRHLSLANDFTVAEAYSYLSSSNPFKYDKILLTLGSLRWLPDLQAFFELCSQWLLPSGVLTIWDFHPLSQCLDADRRIVKGYPFNQFSYKRDEGVRDYVGGQLDFQMFSRQQGQSDVFKNPHPVYISEYSCANVITAAIATTKSFVLTSYQEYSFSWEEKCYPWLVAAPDGCYRSPPGIPDIPLTFILQFSLLDASRDGNHG